MFQQHIGHANYQTCIWKAANKPRSNAPPANDGHGWTMEAYTDIRPSTRSSLYSRPSTRSSVPPRPSTLDQVEPIFSTFDLVAILAFDLRPGRDRILRPSTRSTPIDQVATLSPTLMSVTFMRNCLCSFCPPANSRDRVYLITTDFEVAKSRCTMVSVLYLETIEILNCVMGIVRTKKNPPSFNAINIVLVPQCRTQRYAYVG